MKTSSNQSIAFLNPRLGSGNIGDALIEHSIKKILRYDPRRSIDIDPRQRLSTESIDAINQCDVAVILGTNLWYREISRPGRWQISCADIDRIRVPIIPFGVGTTRHRGEDNRFDSKSLALLSALHQQCTEASVRDPRTQQALTQNGIRNVRMTGCPTLFRSLSRDWTFTPALGSRKIMITPRKGQQRNLYRLAAELKRRAWQVEVAAQVAKDTWYGKRHIPGLGSPPRLVQSKPPLPMLFQPHLEPYLDSVDRSFGAIGWRLHGNLMHLAMGKPAAFFANCSRADSFCEAFGLPRVYAEDGELIPDSTLYMAIDQLADPTVYSNFKSHYRYYYDETVKFLEANRLNHNLTKARSR